MDNPNPEKARSPHAAMSSSGEVMLPKRVRARLGLEPGAGVLFVLNDLGEVVLRRAGSQRL